MYNFHQELKVTPYEVSLKIGPQVRESLIARLVVQLLIMFIGLQYKLEAVIVDFFHSIYDDKPSEARWNNYKTACEGNAR